MSRVVVTITDGKGHARDLDLPMDVPVGIFTPGLAKVIGHADLVDPEQEVKYILKFQGSGEVISGDRTLSTAGALHGDVLTLMVKPVPQALAGAPLAQQFAGPGLAAPNGPVFPLRRSNSTVGRADPKTGVVESLLAVDLAEVDDPDSPSVSRRHAQILFRKGEYLIYDLNSTNGTRLNGQPVGTEDRIALQHGDQVQFGDVVLIFVWDSQE